MSLQVSSIDTRERLESILYVLISFIFAFITIVLLVIFLNLNGFGIDVNVIFNLGFKDVFSDPTNINNIFYNAAPLILTALAVAIAFKAGLFNIGGQGQMMIGGVFSAIWAASIVPLRFPFIARIPVIMIPTTILFGFIGGAIWGFIPGFLKAKTGAHEVITTIMMNLIAASMINFLVGNQDYSPFVDRTSADAQVQSERIVPAAKVSKMFETGQLDYTALIVILVVLLIHILLFRTRFGFQTRSVGLNKDAAEASGINSDRITILSMAIAGGVAGLAGTFFIMGSRPYRYQAGFEGTKGFDGIAVSLIAQNSPLGIILAGIFFGYLKVAKNNIDFNSDFPGDLIFVLQALLILFAATPTLSKKVYTRVKKLVNQVRDKYNSTQTDQSTDPPQQIREESIKDEEVEQ